MGQVFEEVPLKVWVLFHVFDFKELTVAIGKELQYFSPSHCPLSSTSVCYITLKIHRQ